MRTIVAAAALALLVAGCGGTEQATAPASPPPASSMDSPARATPAPPSPSVPPTTPGLPDNPGPSLAPVGSRDHLGRLKFIWVSDGGQGLDQVDLTFEPRTPRCTVRRVLSIPQDWPSGAFLIVRCTPAGVVSKGLRFMPGGQWGPARNVSEVVITRADHRVVVLTIGLRHAAGWSVGGWGGLGQGGPIIAVEQ